MAIDIVGDLKNAGQFEKMFRSVVLLCCAKSVMLHCISGASRSAFLAACLLMGGSAEGSMSPEEALAYLKSVRKICNFMAWDTKHCAQIKALRHYRQEAVRICTEHGLKVMPREAISRNDALKKLQNAIRQHRSAEATAKRMPSSRATTPRRRRTPSPAGNFTGQLLPYPPPPSCIGRLILLRMLLLLLQVA